MKPVIKEILCCLVSLLLFSACRKDTPLLPQASIKLETIPLSDTLPHIIAMNTLLTGNHPWYIKGWTYVNNEASLRIEPGAIINISPGEQYESGGLVVTRGAFIYAAGTDQMPVTFNIRGAGNIILLGKAPVGKPYHLLDNTELPVLNSLAYGGDNSEDSSGVMQHVVIYSGNKGLMLLGTGSKTFLEDVLQLPNKIKMNCPHLP
ncbi:hypothetical protein ACDQ55_01845 [Chitinophaga sp. 30R24]|uniref:hypothetical protein n=1 Tax=Chitinophaga sp. 30R24 TaxID=3248838 RepID=UPI003B90D3A6